MSDPAVIAHRGFAGIAPENTIGAARVAAASNEAATIEIDVQPAACGTPIVFHDERLEGSRDGRPLTDAEGVVWEASLQTLSKTRVLGTDEHVPTLSELLEAVPSTMGVNVELKNPGTPELRFAEVLSTKERTARREAWTPFVERVVADCDAFGGAVLFSSFCEGALAAVRDVAPEYAAGTLVWDSLEDGLELVRRYDCEAIHPPRNAIRGTPMSKETYYGLDGGEPTVDVLETAHEENRAVNVWTVENWLQFEQLRDAGVDGIIAEYPGLGSRADV